LSVASFEDWNNAPSDPDSANSVDSSNSLEGGKIMDRVRVADRGPSVVVDCEVPEMDGEDVTVGEGSNPKREASLGSPDPMPTQRLPFTSISPHQPRLCPHRKSR
jgi:hypothetical protein